MMIDSFSTTAPPCRAGGRSIGVSAFIREVTRKKINSRNVQSIIGVMSISASSAFRRRRTKSRASAMSPSSARGAAPDGGEAVEQADQPGAHLVLQLADADIDAGHAD